MFFSTTNAKGVIESGNSVFVRVSGFEPSEIIGEPHNLIRHPDMPRAVFRLLWQTITAGKPIVAYVKNMAKDGRFYWVAALVLPLREGFLSIRFKPSSPHLGTVEALYRQMREAEQAHGDGGEQGRAGMDAAERILAGALKARGFASYEEFMWTLMHDEMHSREQGLREQGEDKHRLAPASTPMAVRLHAIHGCGERACGQIDRLYRRLDELAGFSRSLLEKSAFVTELTRDIRFVALSTSIKASKLGDAGNSLGIIASFLSESSARTAGDVQRLTARIRDITGELQAVSFQLSAARLQIEMMLIFCRELLEGRGDTGGLGHSRARMIGDLECAFIVTSARATELLGSLGQHLNELNFEAEDLRKTMLMLQVAQVCGMTETSRIHADLSLSAIFDEVRSHVVKTSGQLAELGEITGRFARLILEAPDIEREIRAAIARIEQHLDGLDQAGNTAVRLEVTLKAEPELATA
jgi:aerotaxis receptor